MSAPTLVPPAPDTERTIPPRPSAEDWARDPKQAEADVRARHENVAPSYLETLGWTIVPTPDGDEAA